MHKTDGKKYKKSENVPDINESDDEESDDFIKEIETEISNKTNDFNAHLQVDISQLTDAKLESIIFNEPDDSTMESDSIDPTNIAKELEIFENTNETDVKSVVEFVNNILPNNSVIYGGELYLSITFLF